MNSTEKKIPRVIAISGKIGAGKDTTAGLIAELTPHIKWHRTNFSKRVKEIVATMTGLKYDFLETHEGKNTKCPAFNKTAGELMQDIGNGFRETYGSDIWINLVRDQIGENKYCFITDCRYKNEANWVKSIDGMVIRINGDPAEIRKASKRNLNSPGEIDLDDYDKFNHVIENSGDINQLKEQIKKILN